MNLVAVPERFAGEHQPAETAAKLVELSCVVSVDNFVAQVTSPQWQNEVDHRFWFLKGKIINESVAVNRSMARGIGILPMYRGLEHPADVDIILPMHTGGTPVPRASARIRRFRVQQSCAC
jgi:hypothetical protein